MRNKGGRKSPKTAARSPRTSPRWVCGTSAPQNSPLGKKKRERVWPVELVVLPSSVKVHPKQALTPCGRLFARMVAVIPPIPDCMALRNVSAQQFLTRGGIFVKQLYSNKDVFKKRGGIYFSSPWTLVWSCDFGQGDISKYDAEQKTWKVLEHPGLPSLTAGNFCHHENDPGLICWVMSHSWSCLSWHWPNCQTCGWSPPAQDQSACQPTDLWLHSTSASPRWAQTKRTARSSLELWEISVCCLKALSLGLCSKSQLMDYTTLPDWVTSLLSRCWRSQILWPMFQCFLGVQKKRKKLYYTPWAPIQCHWNHYNSHHDGCYAEATLQRRWGQPVVQGDEVMGEISTEQGPKSKCGGRARQYGGAHKLYRQLLLSCVK